MPLVSWNWRSGFRRKLDSLAALAPDVAIVSECANLEILASKAPGLQPTSALWVGTNPHKGLGVFSFGRYRLVRDDRAYDSSMTFALPVKVEGPPRAPIWGSSARITPSWDWRTALNNIQPFTGAPARPTGPPTTSITCSCPRTA